MAVHATPCEITLQLTLPAGFYLKDAWFFISSLKRVPFSGVFVTPRLKRAYADVNSLKWGDNGWCGSSRVVGAELGK